MTPSKLSPKSPLNKPLFLHLYSTSLLKTPVVKGEIARIKQFLLFSQCFLPFRETPRHFHHRVSNCRLQTLSRLKIHTSHFVKLRNHSVEWYFDFQKLLTLSSIYIHFNTLEKKASGKHC